jgi:hypothetical protein
MRVAVLLNLIPWAFASRPPLAMRVASIKTPTLHVLHDGNKTSGNRQGRRKKAQSSVNKKSKYDRRKAISTALSQMEKKVQSINRHNIDNRELNQG